MTDLPYNAMIVEETYREFPPNVIEYCNHCGNPLSTTVFVIGVPSVTLNGQPTTPEHMMVCSQSCALDWLQAFVPAPYKRERSHSIILPSTVKQRGWIYAYSNSDAYPLDHPLRSGKWLIFLSETTIDRYWQRIAEAVIAGQMGECAKVSSAVSAQAKGGHYVICVYTYDCEDKADVMRIRQVLRECGILRPIRYKRDLDTMLLRYNSEYKPLYVV